MRPPPDTIAVTTIIDHQPAADAHAVANCAANDIALDGDFDGTPAGVWTLSDATVTIDDDVAGKLSFLASDEESALLDASIVNLGTSYFARYTIAGADLAPGISLGVATIVYPAHTSAATYAKWTPTILSSGVGFIVGSGGTTGSVDNFTFEAFEATAQSTGQQDVIDWITYSYDIDPVASGVGLLAIVNESGVVQWAVDIAAAGEKTIEFPGGFYIGDGEGLGVVLTAGGAAVSGKLTVGMR